MLLVALSGRVSGTIGGMLNARCPDYFGGQQEPPTPEAQEMMARMTARLLELPAAASICRTKERSILRVSMGSCWR